MLGEARLNNFSPQASNASVRAFLVTLHQRRKSDDICRQNCRKSAFYACVGQEALQHGRFVPSFRLML